jgi:DNA-binding response OmpR family regulator
MALVIIVEDDASIAELIALYLQREGHAIEIIGNGLAALDRLESADAEPDLLVLDLMLPGLDGRGLARRVRARSTLPILMLTALDDDRDKLEGFDLGADDYITKPFNPNELVARCRAILRRSIPSAASAADVAGPDPSHLVRGNCTIDLEGHRLMVGAQEVTLRTKEFDLLATLARHVEMVLSREQLLELVWAGEVEGDSRTVDVHVSRLRERLAASGASIEIETVRSVGYRLAVGDPVRGEGSLR